MKVISNYPYKALYGTIEESNSSREIDFFVIQDKYLDIYKSDKNNNIKLFGKSNIQHSFIKAFAFKNKRYIWILGVDENGNVWEYKFDTLNNKLKLAEYRIQSELTNGNQIPLSLIVKNGILTLFIAVKGRNILYTRQIITGLNDDSYTLTPLNSFSVLPDVYDFKFDKVNLIINFDMKQFL